MPRYPRALSLTPTASILLAILTATVQASEFLQPWTSGSTKDYSHNINYAVGVHILTEWEADFTNATIALNQDNKPGDAQGGPTAVLERSYNQSTWGWTVSYEGLDPTLNNVFYFSVANGNGSESFTGHYFNISDAPSSTTTAPPSTARTSASLSTASPTTTTSTPASSGPTTPPPTSSSPTTITIAPSNGGGGGGTPVGTVAGMVVGIVVGSFLLAGIAWWVWKVHQKRRRRNINAASGVQPAAAGFASDQPYFYYGGGEGGERKPFEADGGVERYGFHESGGVSVHELRETVRGPLYELHGSVGQPRG